MNELNGSGWFCVQRPRLFCKPEITLETAIWEVVMERAWAQMSLLSFETLLWVKASSDYPEKSQTPEKQGDCHLPGSSKISIPG